MKLVALILGVALLVGGGILGAGHAHGQAVDPPSRMTREDLLEFKAAHFEIAAAIAQLAATPAARKRAAIAQRYGFEVDQLGMTIGINFESGDIERKPAK